MPARAALTNDKGADCALTNYKRFPSMAVQFEIVARAQRRRRDLSDDATSIEEGRAVSHELRLAGGKAHLVRSSRAGHERGRKRCGPARSPRTLGRSEDARVSNYDLMLNRIAGIAHSRVQQRARHTYQPRSRCALLPCVVNELSGAFARTPRTCGASWRPSGRRRSPTPAT